MDEKRLHQLQILQQVFGICRGDKSLSRENGKQGKQGCSKESFGSQF
jgi:hypothetical protein